jgi:UDP-glucose:O-linked fucose beta-1,3-glucosyltransferase
MFSLEQEVMKQQGLLYNQSFLIQQLERKVRRAQGERTDEEKKVLEQKIQELTKETENWKRKLSLLTMQYRKGLDDVRQAKRLLASLEKEKEAVGEEIADLSLYNDSATSQLSAKIREKEEMLVEENIMRLELRKLRSFLNARADNVLSLENRQAQLQLALEERTKEIEIHKEMLRAHIKTAEEERYSANAELRDRLNKIEKLKRKYEIIMTQLPSEEGNEERTQAYYIIKASQV